MAVRRVLAFAKINLALRVLGVRDDGYHELRTIFQSIALHDTLEIRDRRGPFALTCDDPACPADETNLVWRAAAGLWRAAGRRGAPRDVAIALLKRVPLQAGLGGGSSDGAAALAALGRRWRVNAERVRAVAASLGADVPYFLEGGTVLGLDRGDLLFPLQDRPPAWVVLVLPAFGVGTPEAYRWWDADGIRVSTGSNDLQAAVARRHPEIRRIANALTRAGAAEAAMSGSGSAVFGLFSRRSDAARAAAAVKSGTRRVIMTRTVNRLEYQALAATSDHRIHLRFAPRGFGHS
jgi:4-diphosphocytidyl-2-C-methyl-D-erythritol kinase